MSTKGTLLLIQGLAGSGKSHLINFLKHDWCKEEGFARGEEEERANIVTLVSRLAAGKYCIVSERKYRSQAERETFLSAVEKQLGCAPSIHYMCFENDLSAANRNCQLRSNKPNDLEGKDHIAQNELDTKTYEIPDSAVVVKIHPIPDVLQRPLNCPN